MNVEVDVGELAVAVDELDTKAEAAAVVVALCNETELVFAKAEVEVVADELDAKAKAFAVVVALFGEMGPVLAKAEAEVVADARDNESEGVLIHVEVVAMDELCIELL